VGELANSKDTHCCPQNFSGSSKSMEACGAIKLVTEMFDFNDAYVSVIIGDDDSTTRSNLKQSYKELIKSGKWADKEKCPKTKRGKFVDDKGKLPLRVWEILFFLADPSHRGKSFGRALYKLEGKRGKELKFTSIDCEQLKRNFNFWQ